MSNIPTTKFTSVSTKPDVVKTKEFEVQNIIYTIRNQQVMLDFDLARIYNYEVKALNQQVKRNIGRFPEDFMFLLKSIHSRILVG